MTVRVGDRKEGKLGAIDASRILVQYTYDRVKDRDIFPKAERWIMAYTTWQAAFNGRAKLIRGNKIKVATKKDAEDRLSLLKEAVGHLEVLLDCIDILELTERISGDRADHWTKITENTIRPIMGMIKRETNEYKENFG